MFENAMKILLQHTHSGLYVRGPHDWTPNHQDGLEFEHSRNAMGFARDHRLNEVQIAVKFLDSQYDQVFSFAELEEFLAQRESRCITGSSEELELSS
jgi:hypothetical protein